MGILENMVDDINVCTYFNLSFLNPKKICLNEERWT